MKKKKRHIVNLCIYLYLSSLITISFSILISRCPNTALRPQENETFLAGDIFFWSCAYLQLDHAKQSMLLELLFTLYYMICYLP